MGKISFWLPEEEYRQLEHLQRLRGEAGSIHSFVKQIVREYIQGKIRSLAIEKVMKEVSLELEALRKVLLELQLKLEENPGKVQNEVKELLEEMVEKLQTQEQNQGQVQVQGQAPGQTQEQSQEFVVDLLMVFWELAKHIIVIQKERKDFDAMMENMLKKYRRG